MWKIKYKKKVNPKDTSKVIDLLLKNRDIKDKDIFINPVTPMNISNDMLGFKSSAINKILKRLSIALKSKEEIIVFGDYDADGITATAILWETLHYIGFNVKPHIPDRFSEGYG